jgi:hypothetical protein
MREKKEKKERKKKMHPVRTSAICLQHTMTQYNTIGTQRVVLIAWLHQHHVE